jgi:membrane protease YdiL (CAAX protease family)
LSLLPLGLGAWAPVVAGVRCGARRWIVLGALWSVLAVAGWVLASLEPATNVEEVLAVVLLVVAWLGGAVTSFAIRSGYERRIADRRAEDARSSVGRRAVWPWLSLLPLGLGAWAPIVGGVRCGVRRWTVLGLLWSALAVAGWVLTAVASPESHTEGVGAVLIVVAWVAGVITSFVIRPGYERRIGGRVRERVPWPAPTLQAQQWSVRYALIAYVVTFVGVNAVAAALYFGVGVELHVGAGVLFVDAVLLAALVPLRRKRGLTRQDLGLRATPAARSVGLVILALVVYALIAVLWVVVVHPREGANALADVRHQSTINVVLTVFALAVSAPIVEEIFFRGLLYRSLRNRLALWPAALIAGAMFGLVHITSYPVDTLPVKAAFGVIACLLYERTGSLLPGIGLHSFVDASSIDVSLTGNDLIVLGSFLCLAVVLLVRGSRPNATVSNRELGGAISAASTTR